MTCLALLLSRGADLEAKNHNQQTLLQCITNKYGQTRTDRLLKETGNVFRVKEGNEHFAVSPKFLPLVLFPFRPLKSWTLLRVCYCIHNACMWFSLECSNVIRTCFGFAYTTVRDWLKKNSRHFVIQSENQNQNQSWLARTRFPAHRVRYMYVLAWIFDWFTGIFLSFVIGHSDYFCFGIFNWKPL